jgi:YidC/Oxa1 family membrane protein insertase
MTNTRYRQPARFWRWALLAAALVAGVLLVAGCGGASNAAPLTGEELSSLEINMRAIESTPEKLLTGGPGEKSVQESERVNPDGTITRVMKVVKLSPAEARAAAIDKLPDQFGKEADAAGDPTVKAKARFLQGYASEYAALVKTKPDLYKAAYGQYVEVQKSGTSYAVQGAYRAGLLASSGKSGLEKNAATESAKVSFAVVRDATAPPQPFTSRAPNQGALILRAPLSADSARQSADALAYEGPEQFAGGGGTLAPTAAETRPGQPTLAVVTDAQGIHTTALRELDGLYQVSTGWDFYYWHGMNLMVSLFQPARIGESLAVVLALIFIALAVKLVTAPLTNASYRGMRDMQRIQPKIKELQERYKDDKAKFAEEQMKLMKEHKVNPAGGCLPMLIQLPVFLLIFVAIQKYAYHFADARFLWVSSLANPDLILLGLYLVSMFVTQKLTATPTTDPQQEMMQKQMTYLMPIMLAVMLSSTAAAFILYWFFLNVFTFVHQYYFMRKLKADEVSPAADAPVPDVRQPVKKIPPPRSTGSSSKDKKGKQP